MAGDATGGGNDVLDGGPGPDFVLGDSEAFVGSAISGGDDFGLVGDNLSAGAVTSAGHDAVDGGDGNDRLFGDNVDTTRSATVGSAGGNDVLDAGDGADLLRAGPRNDFLDGGLGGPDDCDGEAGTDSMSGCEIVAGVP